MKHYHFIGIGGIGMSALAKLLLEQGCQVSGSDTSGSALLETLRKMGAVIYKEHSKTNVLSDQVIVYSSSIKEDNVEMQEAMSLALPIYHRSDLLDQLMQSQKALLVTGTHGKTSTTALLSIILLQAGLDPSFVVGGLVRALKTNGRSGKGEYFVAEADESDGSFLKTEAFGAIVTNVEEDHLDYWHTKEKLFDAFRTFITQVQNKERLFLCGEDPFLRELKAPGYYYGFSDQFPLQITHYEQKEMISIFSLCFEGKKYGPFEIPLQGKHYVLNATAAIGMALKLGVDSEKIKNTLKNYEGVKRRLEKIGEVNNIKIFDDYGHHPTEVEVTIKALREATHGSRLIVVFQPHRYTRLQYHLLDFAKSFSLADHCVITQVYSAGETPIQEITSELLVSKMNHKSVTLTRKEELIEYLTGYVKPGDVVLMMGAGDITYYTYLLLQRLQGSNSYSV